MPHRTKQSGFTLIEALVALGLLLMIISFTYVALRNSIKELTNAESFSLTNGEYLSFEQQLAKDMRFAVSTLIFNNNLSLVITKNNGLNIRYESACIPRSASLNSITPQAVDEANVKLNRPCLDALVCAPSTSANPSIAVIKRTIVVATPTETIYPNLNGVTSKSISKRILAMSACFGPITLGSAVTIEALVSFATLNEKRQILLDKDGRTFISVVPMITGGFQFN